MQKFAKYQSMWQLWPFSLHSLAESVSLVPVAHMCDIVIDVVRMHMHMHTNLPSSTRVIASAI